MRFLVHLLSFIIMFFFASLIQLPILIYFNISLDNIVIFILYWIITITLFVVLFNFIERLLRRLFRLPAESSDTSSPTTLSDKELVQYQQELYKKHKNIVDLIKTNERAK